MTTQPMFEDEQMAELTSDEMLEEGIDHILRKRREFEKIAGFGQMSQVEKDTYVNRLYVKMAKRLKQPAVILRREVLKREGAEASKKAIRDAAVTAARKRSKKVARTPEQILIDASFSSEDEEDKAQLTKSKLAKKEKFVMPISPQTTDDEEDEDEDHQDDEETHIRKLNAPERREQRANDRLEKAAKMKAHLARSNITSDEEEEDEDASEVVVAVKSAKRSAGEITANASPKKKHKGAVSKEIIEEEEETEEEGEELSKKKKKKKKAATQKEAEEEEAVLVDPDELADDGRDVVELGPQLRRGDIPACNIKISDWWWLESKTVDFTRGIESGSFEAINFRRPPKDNTKSKPYEFSMPERHCGSLYEAFSHIYAGTKENAVTFRDAMEIKPNRKGQINLSNIYGADYGKKKYQIADYTILVEPISYKNGTNNVTQQCVNIRKKKTKVRPSEKPYFECQLPADLLRRFILGIRVYMVRRSLPVPQLPPQLLQTCDGLRDMLALVPSHNYIAENEKVVEGSRALSLIGGVE